MSAALTAFLLLVIVSALGVWIINRGSSGVKEGFVAEPEPEHKESSKEESSKKEIQKSHEEAPVNSLAATPLTQEQSVLLDKSSDLIKMVTEIAQKTHGSVKEEFEGFEGFEEMKAVYTPLQQRIRAHQTPAQPLPAMTVNAFTDKGTGAEAILKDEKKMASIREMIRDETASAVRDELSGSRLFNQYQINYESQ
jgi:hypothetical protein